MSKIRETIFAILGAVDPSPDRAQLLKSIEMIVERCDAHDMFALMLRTRYGVTDAGELDDAKLLELQAVVLSWDFLQEVGDRTAGRGQ